MRAGKQEGYAETNEWGASWTFASMPLTKDHYRMEGRTEMHNSQDLQKVLEIRDAILGGNEKRLKEQREAGKLTARERLDLLLDAGSFEEIGRFRGGDINGGRAGSAVITDGRFSGASGGLSVGYLCPEAAEGGNIALIQDGDMVHINLADNSINFDITDEELEQRRANWTPVVHPVPGKLLKRYQKMVGPAKDGALLSC